MTYPPQIHRAPGALRPLPMSFGEVTADWLTAALARRYPGVRVRDFHETDSIDGTSSKIRIELDYARSAGLPRVMWLKAGFGGAHLPRTMALGIYALEALTYGELIPRVGVLAPEVYAAEWDRDSGQGVILMVDLAPPRYSFPGFFEPLTVDEVADGLTGLARLHGRSWQRSWLSDYGLTRLIVPGSVQERHWRTSYPVEFVASFLDGLVGEKVPPEVRDARRTHAAFWALQPFYQSGPTCLLHGDIHVGNCYRDRDRIGLLDWALPTLGPWAHDVSYWMGGTLSPADRRARERDLLDDYLDQVTALAGVSLDRDQAWEDYRRFLAYGYFTWVRNPASMQSVERNAAVSERFGAAMADHDVFGLLGV